MGTNVDVNRKPLSLCLFVASFKAISLKSDFKHILNDFIHVYSPRSGTDNPLGTKLYDVNRKPLSLCPFVASLKKSLWSLIFYRFLFYVFFFCFFFLLFCFCFLLLFFFHMYIAPGRGRQPIGDKNFMATERPFLFAHILQVLKWSLRNLIVYTFLMILYMHRSAQENSCFFAFTLRTKFLKPNFRGENSARFRVSSRRPLFVSVTFRGETPRTFAEVLREISRRRSAKTRSHFKKR